MCTLKSVIRIILRLILQAIFDAKRHGKSRKEKNTIPNSQQLYVLVNCVCFFFGVDIVSLNHIISKSTLFRASSYCYTAFIVPGPIIDHRIFFLLSMSTLRIHMRNAIMLLIMHAAYNDLFIRTRFYSRRFAIEYCFWNQNLLGSSYFSIITISY